MKRGGWAGLCGLLLPTPPCSGEGLPVDYMGIRMAGMGQAFTAVANDEHAAFSNPAGISRSRNPRSRRFLHRFSPFSLDIGANSNGHKALKGAYFKPGLWFGNAVKQATNNPDTPVEVRASTYPFALMGGKKMPTLLVGIPTVNYFKSQYSSETNSPTTIGVNAQTTSSLVLGIAGTTRQSTFSYGVVARPNVRTAYIYSNYSQTDKRLSSLLTNTANKGVITVAVGVDAGIILTAPDLWFPSLGIAIRNIPTGCDPAYKHPYREETYTVCGSLRTIYSQGSIESTNLSPKVDPTEIRVGVALTPRFPIFGTVMNFRLAGDVFPVPLSVGSASFSIPKLKWTQLLHAGTEIFFGNAISQQGFGLRIGSHQGLPSYGATIGVLGLQFEYASVVEDTSIPKKTRTQRRHLFSTSLIF